MPRKFPHLRIISGVELGEPHWHAKQASDLVAAGRFELVLGSLHGLMLDGQFVEVAQLLQDQAPTRIIGDYLLEVARLISDCQTFSVLARIDYPARYWEQHVRCCRFDPTHFEDEYRHVLDLLAASDRALEINNRIEPHPRSSAGGARPAVRQSPSEATRTFPPPWLPDSPMPLR